MRVDARGATEAELRAIRYGQRPDRLRATGHTASDQVETILYRLATSGEPKGIKPKREDGVVRPLLPLWREETEAFCDERELRFRVDSSNPGTVRGLIRDEILPLLEQIHPAARENILRALEERRTMPPALAELRRLAGRLEARRPRRRRPGGARARPPLARAEPGRAARARCAGAWRIRSELPGLRVRGWRPGDRLAGRSKKIQDVFVDAKVPRSDREGWPLVVRGDEVVAVPGIVEASGRRGGASMSNAELERAVGEVLIEEDDAPGADPRARRRDLVGLRGQGAAARRRAQGRGLLHGRPDAVDNGAVRDRLHGHLELRSLH